ncbi:MAG: DedA family protein [Bacteroidota bacterium]|nr:DedA family protein [Bacteroidota bacterium]
MKNWFKSLHNWGMEWVNTKWGAWALFICAFADASFLPLPTPMFFIALTLLNITKAYKYALFVTLGTLTGALAGYSIGHFAWLKANGEFTGLAMFVFDNVPGFTEEVYQYFHTQFSKWGLGILFLAPLIPVPYKIFSISSGAFDINIFIFFFGTFISQGIRFYLLSFLIIKLGPGVKKLFEFNKKPVVIMVTACIAVVIIAIKVF